MSPSPAPPLTRRLTTLLIANRGEIARRITRTARGMGIRVVAVYSPADATAPFVREADDAVRLDGGYLDAAGILAAAVATRSDAIHPGYGFLSENAEFARAVIAAGLAFIGPDPEAIDQMGDKLRAKALALENDVPILPGSEHATESRADEIGYPILVKAAAGGGGKGMRIVRRREELADAVASATREAKSGFGDERVFLERYVERARHIEIQILGDAHGQLVHLGERECSIQRRHQKILEESPSPRVDPALRSAMGDAALRLARALDYRSAGTVEFLVDDDTGAFFFLEVNARLQVEHPVTEAVTGIDLVREQIRIAEGHPIAWDQDAIQFDGAAIEARLYAEDPANDFLPATGTLDAFLLAEEPPLRLDTGVERGTAVGTDFDPMLAKIIAHAPTREEAVARLALGLERMHLGGIVTNRDFLVATLRSPAFVLGDTTTDFISRVAPARSLEIDAEEIRRIAQAAALHLAGRNRRDAGALASAPSGWTNGRLPYQHVAFDLRAAAATRGEAEEDAATRIDVRYRAQRDGSFRFDDGTRGTLFAWQPDSIDLEVDGRRLRGHITHVDDRLIVQTGRGDVELVIVPRFAVPGAETPSGGLVAPMPGKVIELSVEKGDSVEAGQALVVLEAMKMEHPMRAPHAGIVTEIRVASGDQVEKETLLLVVEREAADEAVDHD